LPNQSSTGGFVVVIAGSFVTCTVRASVGVNVVGGMVVEAVEAVGAPVVATPGGAVSGVGAVLPVLGAIMAVTVGALVVMGIGINITNRVGRSVDGLAMVGLIIVG
jgi:hypothetical protein